MICTRATWVIRLSASESFFWSLERQKSAEIAQLPVERCVWEKKDGLDVFALGGVDGEASVVQAVREAVKEGSGRLVGSANRAIFQVEGRPQRVALLDTSFAGDSLRAK